MAHFPSRMLSEKITAELFAEELNKRNCFDFEYAFQEGDYLSVEKVNKANKYSANEYFTFIYRNNKWVIDWYLPFSNILFERVNEGKVKF